MTSIESKLNKIKSSLAAISDVQIYHYFAPSGSERPYIVWYEEGEDGAFNSDNHKSEQCISGYVELFTATEYDTIADEIQEALNSIDGCGWTYDGVIYGDPISDDNNTIHHTWEWSVI